MTKEIGFELSLTSTSKSTNTSSSSSSQEKTEPSLFDSLMNNAKEKISNTDEVQNTSNKQDDKSNELKNDKNTISSKDSLKTQNNEDTSKNVSSSKELIQNKDEVKNLNLSKDSILGESSKTKQESTSLLDRLLVEAKNTLNKNNAQSNELISNPKNNVKNENSENLTTSNSEKLNSKNDSSTVDKAIKNTDTLDIDDLKIANATSAKEALVNSEEITNVQNNSKESLTKNVSEKVEPEIIAKNDNNTNDIEELSSNTKVKDLKADNTNTIIQSINNQNKSEVTKIPSKSDNVKVLSEEINALNQNNKENIKSDSSALLQNNSSEDISKQEETSPLKKEVTLVKDELKTLDSTLEKSVKTEVKTESTNISKADNSDISIPSNKNNSEKISDSTNSLKETVLSNTTLSTKKENTTLNNTKDVNNLESINKSKETDNVSNVKNEKVAKEFASLNTLENDDSEIELDKDVLNNVKNSEKSDKTELKSLFTQLLSTKKSSENINEIKSTVVNTSNISTSDTLIEEGSSSKNDVFTNMFLSSQKKSYDDMSIKNKSIGETIVKEGKSLTDIKDGAKVLDLNMKSSSIEYLKEDVIQNIKKSSLESIAFNKNIVKMDIKEISNTLFQMQNAASTDTLKVEETNLSVNPILANNIVNKIVGARQQASSMMSDIARQMYENYKPPVTAFKINLSPGTLGSIAIMMKASKGDGISVSLSASNSSTLETMIDSQASLKEALAKNFDASNVSLEFNMKDQESTDSNVDDKTLNNKNSSNSLNSDGTNSLNNEDEVLSDDTNNYM